MQTRNVAPFIDEINYTLYVIYRPNYAQLGQT